MTLPYCYGSERKKKAAMCKEYTVIARREAKWQSVFLIQCTASNIAQKEDGSHPKGISSLRSGHHTSLRIGSR